MKPSLELSNLLFVKLLRIWLFSVLLLDNELSFAPYYFYDNLHQYSKNKINCSCPDCSPKTRNKGRRDRKNYNPAINYKHSDLIKQILMDIDEEEYSLDEEYSSWLLLKNIL